MVRVNDPDRKLAHYGYRHARKVQSARNRRRIDRAEASLGSWRWTDGERTPWRVTGNDHWSRNRGRNEP